MTINKIAGNSGLTMIELLIAMVILAITTTAGYQLYQSQSKAQFKQTQLIEMNQNLRAAMYYLEDELKTAGCNPQRTAIANFTSPYGVTINESAGIHIADSDEILFTRDTYETCTCVEKDISKGDEDGDGDIDEDDQCITYDCRWNDGDVNDPNERIRYKHHDSYGDGEMDLARQSGNGTLQPVAQNIDVLNFVYLDQNGNALPGLPLGPGNRRKISAIQVTLVARSRKPDPDYTNNTAYQNQQKEVILEPSNDHFYRRSLSVTVNCRNMDL